MHACRTVVEQFGTCLKWLSMSVELDLNLLVVLWMCVQLHLSLFSVVRALSLCLVLQCLWTHLDLWGFEIGSSCKSSANTCNWTGWFYKWCTGDASAVSCVMLQAQLPIGGFCTSVALSQASWRAMYD